MQNQKNQEHSRLPKSFLQKRMLLEMQIYSYFSLFIIPRVIQPHDETIKMPYPYPNALLKHLFPSSDLNEIWCAFTTLWYPVTHQISSKSVDNKGLKYKAEIKCKDFFYFRGRNTSYYFFEVYV